MREVMAARQVMKQSLLAPTPASRDMEAAAAMLGERLSPVTPMTVMAMSGLALILAAVALAVALLR
jgi:hypothetical protein